MQTSLFVALRAASAICESSLSPKLAAASWRRIGLEPGAKWDRDVIFVNRAAELFVSQRDASAQQTPPKSSSSALAIVESVSPEKSKCCCGQWVYSNHRFCPNCKAPNEKFVEQDFATLKAGWHKGWKVPATTDIATPSGQDAKLLTQVDDLMRELRKRSASADEGLPSAGPATGSNAPALQLDPPPPKVAKTQSASSVKDNTPASQKEPEETWSSDSEWDLATVAGCASWIVCCFAKSKRQEYYPLAKWYVQRELQPKVVKGKPLYAIFQMNVVQDGKLNSTQGRSAWLKAVATNRSKQFAKVPKKMNTIGLC